MPTGIDPYSISVVPIEQFRSDKRLGHATAFVWERRGKPYLITNWHVVTGKNSETGKNISCRGAEPDRLQAQFRVAPNKWDTSPLDIPLLDAEGDPNWLWHSAHKCEVDVVAIPLPVNPAVCVYQPINTLSQHKQLSVQIGMDVFVLGYPFTPTAPYLPVWKRGSIASEPQLVKLAEKYHLVDTASRSGMSGSPVILRSYGTHLTESGTSIATEPATRFFGVYSGRLKTKNPEDVQLGRVWPESYIDDIIDGNARDPGRTGWPLK